MAVMMVIMAAGSFRTVNTVAVLTENLYQHPLMASSALMEANAHIIAIHRHMRDIILARNDEERERAISEVDVDEANIYRHLSIARESFLGNKDRVDELTKALREWKVIRSEVIELVRAHRTAEAAVISKRRGVNQVENIDREIRELFRATRNEAEKFVSDSRSMHKQGTTELLVLMVVLLLTTVAVLIFIIHKIGKWERELKESEGQITQILEAAGEGIFGLDAEGKTTFINTAGARMIGCRSEDLIGKVQHEILHHTREDGSPYPQDECPIYAAFKDGQVHTIVDEFFWRKDGSRFPVEYTSTPVLEGEKPIGAVVVFRDISKRRQVEEKLADSERRSRAWLDHSPVCTKIVDSDLNLQYMSSAGIESLGIDDISTCYGKPYPFDFYPEPFKKAMRKNLEKVLETGEIIVHEAAELDVGGNELWFHSTLVPVRDNGGKVDYIAVVSIDTTKRKQVEMELEKHHKSLEKLVKERTSALHKEMAARQATEQRFKALFEQSGALCMILDPNTSDGIPVIVDANTAACEAHGYTYEEFIGRTVVDIDGREGKRKCRERTQLILSGRTLRQENIHVRKDGTRFPVAICANRVEVEGEPPLIFTTEQDITELKRTEKALLESERKNREWLENSPVCTKVLDLEFNLQYMSAAGVRALKIDDVSALYGKPFPFDVYSEPVKARISEDLQRALKTHEAIKLEIPAMDRDGNELWFQTTILPVIDEHGNIDYLMVLSLDITDYKRAEEELLINRKLESVGVLAGGVAHDFNNVLAGLFGNIELARQKLLPDHAAYPHLLTANQALDKATSLTKQLLTFAKGGEPLLEMVNIKRVIQDSVELTLSGSNVRMTLSLPNELWQVKGDKGQLSQVITNLVMNADQAMPEGGNLIIEAKNIKNIDINIVPDLSGEFVELSIRDEGAGISETVLEKIFDPYFTTKKTGSGLGLTTVHSIISKHNGLIVVDSELGVSTTFTIYLPAEISSVQKTDAISSSLTEKSQPKTGHILVMDDDEMIREITTGMLELIGYTVDTAVDGNEAVEKYSSAEWSGDPVDVVIMDLTIPGCMGGKEAVEVLLAIDPQARAIVSSGYSTDPVMANFSEYGFKGRLAKPFQMAELEMELSRVLEEE